MSARKWWLLGGVLAAVVALVAGGVFVQRMIWGPPLDLKVDAKAPTPGLLQPLPRSAPDYLWRLPRPKVKTSLERSSNWEGDDRYIGVFGEHAYFATSGQMEGRSDLSTVVYGVDIKSGQMVAPPVVLDGYRTTCLRNGPSVLCVDRDHKKVTVLDPSTGAVAFSGPTNLPSESADLTQQGEYAVLGRADVGWSGLGQKGELTWTAPGGGQFLLANSSPTLPSPVLWQGSSTADYKGPDVLFSVQDGTVLHASTTRFGDLYRDGFMGKGDDKRSLSFYDEHGQKVNTLRVPDGFTVETETHFRSEAGIARVTGPTGKRWWLLLDHRGGVFAMLPRPSESEKYYDSVAVVGGRLFAWDSRPENLQQFDIHTGALLNRCDGIGLGHVVGTDGSIYVVETAKTLGGPPLPHAYDVSSCVELWSFDTGRVVNVGNVLLRISDDEIAAIKPV